MSGTAARPWNRRSFRRLLVDMHIPDWDPAFLSRFNPAVITDQITQCGAEAVMLYFQSHVGLCNWPTESGLQHSAFQGRDPMAEMLAILTRKNFPVAGYYSVNFNNWAAQQHPDWRIEPLTQSAIGILPRERYGLCCLNNPEYRAFVREQITEIVQTYSLDAFFFDMVWWMGVCGCPHCRERCRQETGADIPEKIDWSDPAWCAYQERREGWISELAAELRGRVQATCPDLQVYHNFALAMANWTRGVSFDSARNHDFLGGDFYGGRTEQLVISRLMLNLSESRPVEFMTTVSADLTEHVRLKSEEDLALQTFAAAANSSAFLMIAAFDPDGTLNPAVPERIKRVYDRLAPYEPFLGGKPVEDIAVYFSSESKMNFRENARPLDQAPASSAPDYPHFRAVAGACAALQEHHLPFGVISARQLDRLDAYDVIILPNVLRLSPEEAAAFRAYVHRGGRLYASRGTSLTETAGTRHDDFMLADVFGCHFAREEEGRIIYLRPASPDLRDALAPTGIIGHWRDEAGHSGAMRLQKGGTGRPLASLTLPYAYPASGTLDGRDWASIHSFPPWQDLDLPVVVENDFGKGRAIYAAADIETASDEPHKSLFLALIRRLRTKEPRFAAVTHPLVWVTAFDQPDRQRTVMTFLNYQQDPPVIALENIPFRLRAPEGHQIATIRLIPEGDLRDIKRDKQDDIHAVLPRLHLFQMVVAEWR